MLQRKSELSHMLHSEDTEGAREAGELMGTCRATTAVKKLRKLQDVSPNFDPIGN